LLYWVGRFDGLLSRAGTTFAVRSGIDMAEQLRMHFPTELLSRIPFVDLPSEYSMRTFRAGDEERFGALMVRGGFEGWNAERVRTGILPNPLSPSGVFFVSRGDDLVATACSMHRQPTEGEYAGQVWGELGWVAADPDHRGKGLGQAVCTSVLHHFAALAYRSVFLLTDDWRLPALKTYLKLGFRPVLKNDEIRLRWRKVYESTKWSDDCR
jgi:mycothiol synthase